MILAKHWLLYLFLLFSFSLKTPMMPHTNPLDFSNLHLYLHTISLNGQMQANIHKNQILHISGLFFSFFVGLVQYFHDYHKKQYIYDKPCQMDLCQGLRISILWGGGGSHSSNNRPHSLFHSHTLTCIPSLKSFISIPLCF